MAAEAPFTVVTCMATTASPSGGLPKRFLKDVHDVLIAVPVLNPNYRFPGRVVEEAGQGHEFYNVLFGSDRGSHGEAVPQPCPVENPPHRPPPRPRAALRPVGDRE